MGHHCVPRSQDAQQVPLDLSPLYVSNRLCYITCAFP